MKPKNFPARKLKRKLKAAGEYVNSEVNLMLLNTARNNKTKKNRSKKG